MPRGGKRTPAGGRPVGSTKPGAARAALHVRVTEAQRERWRLAAEAEGRSVGEVARELLDAWAERVVKR